MSIEEALSAINDRLNIQAAVTATGELKCYCPSTVDQGVDKTYLDDLECMKVSLAFLALSNALRAARSSGKGGGT